MSSTALAQRPGESIRVRGCVQGVGFRPWVWRVAHELGLDGSVRNDGQGLSIEAWGSVEALDELVSRIRTAPPPLARVETVERVPAGSTAGREGFAIVASRAGPNTTGVLPDAATCQLCAAEVRDPLNRRFRYPFTNCTHCGPRFSIARSVPYDRAGTTMRGFPLCTACAAEYTDPTDRRFHAQPNACFRCGPSVTLQRSDGRAFALDALTSTDAVDAACSLLQRGEIVAVKGLGAYHLACDGTSSEAVVRLRERKQRPDKPLALMARDLAVVHAYAEVSPEEERLLLDAAAPIVLLRRRARPLEDAAPLATEVSGASPLVGFFLAHTPLHHLMLARMSRPVVMTSGNRSEAPPCIDDTDARERLGRIADHILLHDRRIANRVDDSVVRVLAGEAQVLRRARGYAPAPLAPPPGFERMPAILAFGAHLKNTFCLADGDRVVLSQHIGDLDDAHARADYEEQIDLLAHLFDHRPEICAVDAHPEYASSRLGRERAAAAGLPVVETQHHHAHVASCLFENGIPLDHPPVLGVALDGLGHGTGGELWGGEFLLADYAGFERRGTFKPVALIGGEQAMRQPWRNTLAHVLAEMGWAEYALNFAELELTAFLEARPRAALERLAETSRPASSCGRLFDAVAAAVGIARESISYEGQAAAELEAAVDPSVLASTHEESLYPFAVPRLGGGGLPYVEPLAMWRALFGDLVLGTPVGVVAARFHKGLAEVVARMATRLAREAEANVVALTGGVFQNRTLLELVVPKLEQAGLRVLRHRLVPCNDGGVALGQVAIASARSLRHPGAEPGKGQEGSRCV